MYLMQFSASHSLKLSNLIRKSFKNNVQIDSAFLCFLFLESQFTEEFYSVYRSNCFAEFRESELIN